ncbi:sortase family protein [Actinomycetospora succinea]|uniref:Sortase family protein n=1 Tax=Actinomycetospora succinea TaxID=663603 RepID=A0A4R6VRG8_9PSEU|nr:class F sortase [Actinomycetospora succinea]TDQ65060.1 sortase family protein [Actinomycetospora succinea]
MVSRRPGRRARVVAVLALLVTVLVGCAGDPRPPAAPGSVSGSVSGSGPAAPVADGRVVPGSVRVPAIDVDEDALVPLGVAPDGTAEVPQDFGRVGWFAAPGAATVLLGHVDSRSGPAVFFRLRDLRPGDVIEVGRSDGSVARYGVERTEQVAKDAFPTFAVFGATPDDVLRLVTCAGEFDRGARSYTDNLVVHAVRI